MRLLNLVILPRSKWGKQAETVARLQLETNRLGQSAKLQAVRLCALQNENSDLRSHLETIDGLRELVRKDEAGKSFEAGKQEGLTEGQRLGQRLENERCIGFLQQVCGSLDPNQPGVAGIQFALTTAMNALRGSVNG